MSRKKKVIIVLIFVFILRVVFGVGPHVIFAGGQGYGAIQDFNYETQRRVVTKELKFYAYSFVNWLDVCFVPGCTNSGYELPLFTIAVWDGEHDNPCHLLYVSLNKDDPDYSERKKGHPLEDFYYQLYCDVNFYYIVDFPVTENLEKSYPDTLGILIKNGVPLPTRSDRDVLLGDPSEETWIDYDPFEIE
jgi:hypothetical protein